MTIFYSGNLIRDIDRHLNEEAEYEARLPKCHKCGQAIDDYLYEIDEEILCYDCMVEKYRRDVEDYIE